MKMRVLVLFIVLISCVCGNPRRDAKLTAFEPEPYKFYSRSAWRALPATATRPLKTPVEYVVIHHTYKPGACNTTETCSSAMRAMQSYHLGLGWGDIGYQFCVGSDGGVYEGRGWGVVGIHAGKLNSVSLGICLIGDWRIDTPPQNQLEVTKALIASGVDKGVISQDYKLIGHMQAMPTECPGAALMEQISNWEHFVRQYS